MISAIIQIRQSGRNKKTFTDYELKKIEKIKQRIPVIIIDNSDIKVISGDEKQNKIDQHQRNIATKNIIHNIDIVDGTDKDNVDIVDGTDKYNVDIVGTDSTPISIQQFKTNTNQITLDTDDDDDETEKSVDFDNAYTDCNHVEKKK
eukprot:379544_1